MPWAGFEAQTLGAGSNDGDHYTILLPQVTECLACDQLANSNNTKNNRWIQFVHNANFVFLSPCDIYLFYHIILKVVDF